MDTYNTPVQVNTYDEDQDIEELYPEIYKIVYPMICKICNNPPARITEEVIENMTNEIYINIESQEMTQTTVKVQTRNVDSKNVNTKELKTEETRQQNFLLKDLIRILILRELLRRRRPGARPPFPPHRPPMPRSIYEQRFYDNDNYLY